MTHYKVFFYCDDDRGTHYSQTMHAVNGDPTGAAERIFEVLPPLPGDIIGVIVVETYFH